MASKMSAPKLPRLEMVKVPDWNSSGASCFARARFTRSACTGSKVGTYGACSGVHQPGLSGNRSAKTVACKAIIDS